MLGVEKGTAEEFYSQCLGNAQVLDRSARLRARDGDAVGAVACAWGSDLATVQALTWERILVASRNPQRQYYEVAEVVLAELRLEGSDDADEHDTTAEQVLRAGRRRLLRTFDAALAKDVQNRWNEISYLSTVPAFSEAQLLDAVNTRLLGVTAAEFIEHRRREAAAAMLEAQARRVHGDTEGAIKAGYDSSFFSLDAYLVESAIAVGDTALLTVVCRWELATRAVAALTGLPADFMGALGVVRETLARALGEADGARMLRTFATL